MRHRFDELTPHQEQRAAEMADDLATRLGLADWPWPNWAETLSREVDLLDEAIGELDGDPPAALVALRANHATRLHALAAERSGGRPS